MSKKKTPAKPRSAPDLATGTPVRILRPHLYGGASGEVVSVSPDGDHRIRIMAKPELGVGFFHTDCRAEQIEVDL